MITFVVYHTLLPKSSIETIVSNTKSLQNGFWSDSLKDYETYIQILFASAQKHHPDCKCVILTDRSTPFSLPVIRFDLDPSKPALMRLKAQIEFLKQSKEGPIVFLDYDMIIQENLLKIENFDLALSYRNSPETPINGGFLFVRDIPKALLFLNKVHALYERKYTGLWNIWGGAQRCLIETIGYENFQRRESDIINVEGCNILLLPADTYNYSTENDQMDGFYPDKKILHFKGNRKKEMISYWNKCKNIN